MTGKIVSIESYGCAMNQGEAGYTGRLLADLGYTVEEGAKWREAEINIIFTCFVIESTERRMWRRIEELSDTGNRLVVAGCLPAVRGDEISTRFPGIEMMDTMGISATERSVRRLFEPLGNSGSFEKAGDRLDRIVPLSTGCLGNCFYCITKEARNQLVSRHPKSIMDGILDGLRQGRREILLTSQDTAVYGRDLKKGMDLGALLRRITDTIPGEYRMRVGMMNPRGAAEILDSIKEGFEDQRVFKFFHIPVQSGSNKILQAMNRPYAVGEFLELVGSLRSSYPDMTLSTDIIVGYPGETEEDFKESLSLIRQTEPDILNITRFSSRPGTRAHQSVEKIPGWVVKERSRELTKVHEKLLERILERRVGYHSRCLVTEVGKPGTMMARDSNYTPIVIRGNKNLLGKFVDIRTVKKGPTYLISDYNRSVSDHY